MIPGDQQYSYDCIVEYGEITADAAMWSCYISKDAAKWYDDLAQSLDHAEFLREFPRIVLERYNQWFSTTDNETLKVFCTLDALLVLRHQVKEISWTIASEFIWECEKRGLSENKALIRAKSYKHIKKSMVRDNYFKRLTNIVTPFYVRFNSLAKRYTPEEIFAMHADGQEYVRNLQRSERDRIIQAFESMQVKKKRSNAVKKSIDVLKTFMGEETAKAFIEGDRITIYGKKFDFVLKRGDIGTKGHGGTDIEVTDKEGVLLTSLCYYYEDTFAAEQVVSLAMHVMSGDEEEILRIGNFMRMTDTGKEVLQQYQKEFTIENVFPEFKKDYHSRLIDEVRPYWFNAMASLISHYCVGIAPKKEYMDFLSSET